MSTVHLNADEMKRYNLLSSYAKAGTLSDKDRLEWQRFGERYAVQLEDERKLHIGQRKAQMDQFLAEKRAWAEAKAAHDAAEIENQRTVEAVRSAPTEHPGDIPDPYEPKPYAVAEPERDFNVWLKLKGFA